MKRLVITHNVIEGFHSYPNAPEEVDFLQYRHRHNFVVRCKFQVSYSNREVEIFLKQDEITKKFKEKYGIPAEFHNMSCEMIGEWILEEFDNCIEAEVLEDGFGGAIIQR